MRRREKNKQLYLRLIAWGEWCNNPVYGLELSGKTPIAKMVEMGGVCGSGTKGGQGAKAIIPSYWTRKHCAEINRLVDDLPKWPRNSLIASYVKKYKKNELRQQWEKSLQHYYYSLNQAHRAIAEALNFEWE